MPTLPTFCMGRTWVCHTTAQAGWAEGGQAQVQLTYLGSPTFLPGRARLGTAKHLIGLATAGVCPIT